MSAQPYFRSRAQRRDRDAELERLVAAELDACEAPIETLVESPPDNAERAGELSAAELDFVELVRQWLDRRPNKHQLMQLLCDGVVPSQMRDPFLPPMDSARPAAGPIEPSVAGPESVSPAEPVSHAAP